MIAAWIIKAGGPLVMFGVCVLVAAALGSAAAFFYRDGVVAYERIITDRVAAAVSQTDAKWQAAIAEANMKAAQVETARAQEASRMNSELASARETARLAQDELEKANAALPDGARNGLDAGRVQLLNRR